MPNLYNQSSLQYNTDVTYLGFIYRTSRQYLYNADTTYNEPVRYIGDGGSGESDVVYRRNLLRSSTNNGYGDDSSIIVRVVIRETSGSATGSESSTEAEIIYVTAFSDDIVNGTSSTTIEKQALRSSVDAGLGSAIVLRRLTALRSSTDNASGYMNTAIGVNAGKTLDAKIRMSPYWSKRKPRHIRIR